MPLPDMYNICRRATVTWTDGGSQTTRYALSRDTNSKSDGSGSGVTEYGWWFKTEHFVADSRLRSWRGGYGEYGDYQIGSDEGDGCGFPSMYTEGSRSQ
jgi:hypothetical protein